VVEYEDGCEVTAANGETPPGERANRAHHGNAAIWTTLWRDGTVIFEPEGPGLRSDLDGSLSMKWPWWRGVEGGLEITGRRLDAEAPPLAASVPDGYGESGFQVSALVFPTPGCWEVSASVGESSLTFVTRVVSTYPPFVRYEVGDVTLESCPVTEANGVLPPDGNEALAYGRGGVSTVLWPDGTVVFEPGGPGEVRDDGSLAMKWLWLRGDNGPLLVSGRRLDAEDAALGAEVPEGYGASGLQPSVLVFPSPGCWEVTGRVGQSALVFVTRVVSLY
jgi:hypothetical protein